MYALVVTFDLKPELAEAFDDLTRRTLAGIRGEEGTLLYLTSTVTGAPLSRVFVEVYADEAAFAEHERNEHTQAFLRDREPMIDSFRVDVLDAIDGKAPGWWA